MLPHPDERVEWEFWTNSGDECGAKCDSQKAFIRDFSAVATSLEQGGYTQFTPHYVTWLCPPEYINDPACVSQCINNGRYCCPDPDDDLSRGYSGRVVTPLPGVTLVTWAYWLSSAACVLTAKLRWL